MTKQQPKRKPRKRVKRGPDGLSAEERRAQTSFVFSPEEAHKLVAEALITNPPRNMKNDEADDD